MEKNLMNLGFEVAFNPPVDGDCFYFSAANALGIETHNLKNVIFKYVCVRRLFDYLKSHRFDKDKKTANEEQKQMDVSITNNDVKPREESLSHGERHQEEKIPLPSSKNVSEISMTSKYERSSETKVVGARGMVSGGHEKENETVGDITNNIQSSEHIMRGRESAAQVQDTATTNVQLKSKNITKEHVVQEKTTSKLSDSITAPSCPPPRSPSSGHRQLPAVPPPRMSQTVKENTANSHSMQGFTERNEQRTSTAKPLTEVNSNASTSQQPVVAPKSNKARAAPPVPMPRSSGSTSAPVPVPRSSGSTSGRSQAPPADTSGYPDSFAKRKSRDSREITEAALDQLAKDIKASKAVSPGDVKLSSQVVTAKYTPKPTTPQPTQHSTTNTPATLEVSSETSHDKHTSDINNKNNDMNRSWEEPKKRFTQPIDATVEQHKKSCCVLM